MYRFGVDDRDSETQPVRHRIALVKLSYAQVVMQRSLFLGGRAVTLPAPDARAGFEPWVLEMQARIQPILKSINW
jgi:hypothetical protein